jgi:hypothetical protein
MSAIPATWELYIGGLHPMPVLGKEHETLSEKQLKEKEWEIWLK